MVTKEIGKLNNGKQDPCYTCDNCDTTMCEFCNNYQSYRPKQNMVTKGKWEIQQNDTDYEDIKTYTILEPNPDAGKAGVCFSGEFFGVTTLDSKEDTELIVTMQNQCVSINPDNPMAVAVNIEKMYVELKAIQKGYELMGGNLSGLNKVLASIERKE